MLLYWALAGNPIASLRERARGAVEGVWCGEYGPLLQRTLPRARAARALARVISGAACSWRAYRAPSDHAPAAHLAFLGVHHWTLVSPHPLSTRFPRDPHACVRLPRYHRRWMTISLWLVAASLAWYVASPTFPLIGVPRHYV